MTLHFLWSLSAIDCDMDSLLCIMPGNLEVILDRKENLLKAIVHYTFTLAYTFLK